MNSNIFKTVLIYTSLFVICFVNKTWSSPSNHSDHPYYSYRTNRLNRIHPTSVKLLNLKEGDLCRKSQGLEPEYVCVNELQCKPFVGRIKSSNSLDICSFDGSQSVVCCPSSEINKRSKRASYKNSADEKCREYSQLEFEDTKRSEWDEQTAGEKYLSNILKGLGGPAVAKYQDFPHMAMLGYGATPEEMDWRCAGSLISERWILTAAHCYKLGSVARWARLGDVDRSPVYAGQHKDYEIDEHVVHPNYKDTERYYDIAVFRLQNEVEFSGSIRPICLNTDPSLDGTEYPIVNVWGKTYVAGQRSNVLIKVPLNNIPMRKCQEMWQGNKDQKIKRGLLADSMICAGTLDVLKLVCTGDSGGALQIKNELNPKTFKQIGVTSFGSFCGIRNTPGVHTRVSKYVKWIERIVWSDDD